MCWNFQISVAAASLEAGLLLLIVIRACRSSEHRFHQQLVVVANLIFNLTGGNHRIDNLAQ